MRLDDAPESQNVEDRRGMRLGGRRGAGIGCVGLLVIVGISLLTGTDPRRLLSLLGGLQETAPASQSQTGPADANDPQAVFVRKVLGTTEATWGRLFTQAGKRYEEPTLVLFDGHVDSACGFSSSAVGPFYCPSDQKVYLDLSFFRELGRRFEAPGDFAQAYVVAHEIGHHVQNLLGISDQVESARERARSQQAANAYMVRLELQADCFAGIWGRSQQEILDPGDIEEGLRAAAAIGDDMIQKQSQGYVAPESWTHGSAAMRVRWLRRGLETGDMASCDTFRSTL
jgi:predicted metalloprotease